VRKISILLHCFIIYISTAIPYLNLQVFIHGERRFLVGLLSYEKAPVPVDDGVDLRLIAGLAGGGGAAMIILVIVAVLLHRRSTYHKQKYKSMVKHVDQLESNARQEIKAGQFCAIIMRTSFSS